MSTREQLDLIIRRIQADHPNAMRAYRLQVQLATYQEIADMLRPEHPEAAELVDLNALLSRAALVELYDGPPTAG